MENSGALERVRQRLDDVIHDAVDVAQGFDSPLVEGGGPHAEEREVGVLQRFVRPNSCVKSARGDALRHQ